MPSDRAANSVSTAALRSIPDAELKARIRAELACGFVWPSSLAAAAKPLYDLSAVMDLGKLANVAAAVNNGKELGFTIISKEYIQTGLNWINAMQRLGLSNFFIVAGDKTTSEKLDERGIHSVRADIDEGAFDPSFVSHDGFSAKGLAMIALKFPVMNFLVKSGYSVTFSDADAVWLDDPMAYVRGAGIAFQRVVYHPAPIARVWGFTACSGFVSFRHSINTIAFLDRCIVEQRSFRCDQVAMNVALLGEDPDWHCEHADWILPVSGVQHDRSGLEAAFAKCARSPITGELRHGRIQVLALPHDKFWRHGVVAHSLADTVICHPNSPKNDLEKMKIFDAMGLRFLPGIAVRGSIPIAIDP
jgi:Nucleotide-diphospho-sugar transferase